MDYIFGILFVFMFAVFLLVAYLVFNGLNDAVQADANFGSLAKSTMATQNAKFPLVFDYVLLMVYVAIIIGGVILSYVLPTNPGLYFALVLVVVIVAGVAGFLANTYYDMVQTTAFSAAGTNFPITSFLIEHYITFSVLAGFIMLVAFFARPQEGYA